MIYFYLWIIYLKKKIWNWSGKTLSNSSISIWLAFFAKKLLDDFQLNTDKVVKSISKRYLRMIYFYLWIIYLKKKIWNWSGKTLSNSSISIWLAFFAKKLLCFTGIYFRIALRTFHFLWIFCQCVTVLMHE